VQDWRKAAGAATCIGLQGTAGACVTYVAGWPHMEHSAQQVMAGRGTALSAGLRAGGSGAWVTLPASVHTMQVGCAPAQHMLSGAQILWRPPVLLPPLQQLYPAAGCLGDCGGLRASGCQEALLGRWGQNEGGTGVSAGRELCGWCLP
jgi:hypothetical protein